MRGRTLVAATGRSAIPNGRSPSRRFPPLARSTERCLHIVERRYHGRAPSPHRTGVDAEEVRQAIPRHSADLSMADSAMDRGRVAEQPAQISTAMVYATPITAPLNRTRAPCRCSVTACTTLLFLFSTSDSAGRVDASLECRDRLDDDIERWHRPHDHAGHRRRSRAPAVRASRPTA